MGGIKKWLTFICALVATGFTDLIIFLILNGIINVIEKDKIMAEDTNFTLAKIVILSLFGISSFVGYIKLFDSVFGD
jgi:hypothetical protein